MKNGKHEAIHCASPNAAPTSRRRRWIGLIYLVVAAAMASPAQTNEVTLYNFGNVYPHGEFPAGLTRGPEGNFYGIAAGGKHGAGVVFKLDETGHETVLYTFTGGADGNFPTGALLLDPAGYLYGVTSSGGSAGAGVVFMVDKTGQETVLYNFTGGADGGSPVGGVVRDLKGNFYGATNVGGDPTCGCGVVYKLDASGNETPLYTFTGGFTGPDGSYPDGGMILDKAGNLYGTTFGGGSGAWGGIVFKVDPAGNETILYTFNCALDGCNPDAGLARDQAGNLYGTTLYGGSPGAGNVFKLDINNNETSLYSFTGGADGGYPTSGVILDPSGNLDGTTANGGNTSCGGYYGAGCGVVYKVDPAGNETVLYIFAGGSSGYNAGVVRDSAGNLYGTAPYGGTAGVGAVFEVDTGGHPTVLYGFPAGQSAGGGTQPHGLVRDAAGNLYGTTSSGGSNNLGTVFKLDTSRHLTVLHTFTGGTDGGNPGLLTLDEAGNLYGPSGGGAAGGGVLWKLDTSGDLTILYSFTGGADGAGPNGPVILDSAGNIYGTTAGGGNLADCAASIFAPAGCGVVYKVDPAGNQTILYTFAGGTADGANPDWGLFRSAAGALYGTTHFGGAGGYGTVFKIGSSGETLLYSFGPNANEGAGPPYGVILDQAGNLYGTTIGCSGACWGMLYQLDPSGNLTVLHNFTNGADGAFPNGGLIRDAAGNLYGTTWEHSGTVYKLDTAGNLTTLLGNAGNPSAGVIRDKAGNLYGAGIYGGEFGGGFIFELY